MQKHCKRSLNNTFFIVTILFLSALSSACTTNTPSALASSSEDPTTIVLKPRTFALNTHGQPLLKLNGDVCQVRVQIGNSPSMLIQTTIHHYQRNPMPTISYKQSGDRSVMTIDEKLPPQTALDTINDSVAITITIPRHMDLFLSTRVGNITVSDISGQFALSTSTGNISVTRAQLNRLSSLTANVGNIFFVGTLMSHGAYRMETHVGSINLAFPRQPSLNVDAQTTIGSIHSDFSSLAIDGNIAQGTLGTPPYGHLSLATRVGSIAVLSQ